jgi:hypothetical protein
MVDKKNESLAKAIGLDIALILSSLFIIDFIYKSNAIGSIALKLVVVFAILHVIAEKYIEGKLKKSKLSW